MLHSLSRNPCHPAHSSGIMASNFRRTSPAACFHPASCLLGSHIIMPLRIVCPQCDAVYAVPDDLQGKLVRCKQCQHRWTAAAEEKPPATPVLEEAHEEETTPTRRRTVPDYENDDEPRPVRKKAAKRGPSGVKIFLWIAAGAIPALILLVFGIVFLVKAVIDAGTTPTEQISAALPNQPVEMAGLGPHEGVAEGE